MDFTALSPYIGPVGVAALLALTPDNLAFYIAAR